VSSARQRPLAVPRPAVLAIAAAGLLIVAILISACGTGQVTQTSTQLAAVNGGQAQVGPIAIRNAEWAYPSGGQHFYARGSSAPLSAAIVNTGSADDALVSASSPVAGSVRIDGQKQIPAQTTLRVVADESTATGQDMVRIVLENLTQDVKPGKSIRLTLVFQRAGQVNVAVPIANPEETTSTSG
jgi:periplasmic copper chaperone A